MGEPVVIKFAKQFPITSMKNVSWDYNKTIVTYKGKEVGEEINESGGMTYSRRCYALEKLRGVKHAKES